MRVELGVNVAEGGMRTPHRFCREEAARSQGDSLVVYGKRAFQIADPLLGVLQAFHGVG